MAVVLHVANDGFGLPKDVVARALWREGNAFLSGDEDAVFVAAVALVEIGTSASRTRPASSSCFIAASGAV